MERALRWRGHRVSIGGSLPLRFGSVCSRVIRSEVRLAGVCLSCAAHTASVVWRTRWGPEGLRRRDRAGYWPSTFVRERGGTNRNPSRRRGSRSIAKRASAFQCGGSLRLCGTSRESKGTIRRQVPLDTSISPLGVNYLTAAIGIVNILKRAWQCPHRR